MAQAHRGTWLITRSNSLKTLAASLQRYAKDVYDEEFCRMVLLGASAAKEYADALRAEYDALESSRARVEQPEQVRTRPYWGE